MKYYAGSLWHESCDPFLTVVAIRAHKAETLLDRATKEELDEVRDSTPEDKELPEDDIMTGGVCEMTADELGLSEEQEAELKREGYLYI